jgi:CheY-like chemotaxis protein
MTPTTRRDTVLVVDDDQEILNLLELALGDEGYAVSRARNGREALNVMENEVPGLILLDLMMPVMNGWAFCQELKKRDDLRSIPVVLMSADRRLDRKVQEAQATDHLRKPFDLTTLYEVVQRYLPRPSA